MLRLHSPLLDGLDEWIAEQPKPQPSRPDAVRTALKDWLTGLGVLKLDSKEAGPVSRRSRRSP